MLALLTWSTLLVAVPVCLSSVIPEKSHKFLAVPLKQKVPVSSNVTINCTTTDANAKTSIYFRRSPQQNTWKLLKPGSDQIVQESPQVYTLIKAVRANTGHYQCRAWKEVNGTAIAWPSHAGKIIVKKLKRGSKKPDIINQGKKKPQSKNVGKKQRPDSGEKSSHKRPDRKRPGHKKSGNTKTGHKNPGNKRQRHKKPDSRKRVHRKPDRKRPGKRRPGGKKPTRKNNKKRPASKRHRKKRPLSRKSGKNGPGPKKSNKKSGPKKVKPSFLLKSPRTTINVVEGRNAVLNCVVKIRQSFRIRPRDVITIRWYKDGQLISKPIPSHLSIVSKNKPAKRKYLSILKIKGFQTARDQGAYQCRFIDKKGRLSAPLTITVKSKSS